MKHAVIRTDTADAGIRKIILYIAQNFGNTDNKFFPAVYTAYP